MTSPDTHQLQQHLMVLTGWQAYIPTLYRLALRKIGQINLSEMKERGKDPQKLAELQQALDLAGSEAAFIQALQQARGTQFYVMLWGPALAGFGLGYMTRFWLFFLAAAAWILCYQSYNYITAIAPQREAARRALAIGKELGVFETGSG